METMFSKLRSLNVNDKVEKKDNMSYLPWATAWDIFVSHYPNATYEVIKNHSGLPYFYDHSGAMVYTKITVDGLTHEMWLPVMDSKNKPMKSEPYKYITKTGEKTVDAYTMFDINKTIMRCLVKNMAMFGLGLYLYKGEDLPEEEEQKLQAEKLKAYENAYLQTMRDAAMNGKDALREAYKGLPESPYKAEFWKVHGESLLAVAGAKRG